MSASSRAQGTDLATFTVGQERGRGGGRRGRGEDTPGGEAEHSLKMWVNYAFINYSSIRCLIINEHQ